MWWDSERWKCSEWVWCDSWFGCYLNWYVWSGVGFGIFLLSGDFIGECE